MVKRIFSIPKISKCETFIWFSFWNAEKWKYQLFKKHLSRKIPPKEVKKELVRMVAYWTTELKNGYNPYAEKKEQKEAVSYNYIGKAVEDVCSLRTEFLRQKSKETYTSKVTIFLEWLKLTS